MKRRDLAAHRGHTYEDQMESGEFDALNYCGVCGCLLNRKNKPETAEAWPQLCKRCNETDIRPPEAPEDLPR